MTPKSRERRDVASRPGGSGTRARILDAALACFLEAGYEQTTVVEIRERSGVSNGSLFHHFPTKEAIADALYVDAIGSFQEGLWRQLQQRPRSLRSAVRAVIAHQVGWITANMDRARFVYGRGVLEWHSPASEELGEMNRRLSAAYQAWLEPLVDRGQVRPMPMLVVIAVVTGPTHALARRWLAGQLQGPLEAYVNDLAEAATAALSGSAAPSRRPRRTVPQRGRVRLELVAEDGAVIGHGEATVEIVPADG
jgi:AcrR family transcriptional regulator